jgi:hypothetical protein
MEWILVFISILCNGFSFFMFILLSNEQIDSLSGSCLGIISIISGLFSLLGIYLLFIFSYPHVKYSETISILSINFYVAITTTCLMVLIYLYELGLPDIHPSVINGIKNFLAKWK